MRTDIASSDKDISTLAGSKPPYGYSVAKYVLSVIDRPFWSGRRGSKLLTAPVLGSAYQVSDRTTANRVLRTLRWLDLIDTQGAPTERLKEFYQPWANLNQLLAQAVRSAYAPIFNLLISRGSSLLDDVDEAFKVYQPGQMFAQTVALFRDLCNYSGGVGRVMVLSFERNANQPGVAHSPAPAPELVTAPLPALVEPHKSAPAGLPAPSDTSKPPLPGTVSTITVNAQRGEVSQGGTSCIDAPSVPLSPAAPTEQDKSASPGLATNQSSSRRLRHPVAPPQPSAATSTTQTVAQASSSLAAALPPWSPAVTGDAAAVASEVEDVTRRFAAACRDHSIRLAGIDVAGAMVGPRVLRIPLGLAPGETISRLQNRLLEISIAVRREGLLLTPMPARGYIALDVPRSQQFLVPFISEGLPSLANADRYRGLPFAVGVTPEGERVVAYFGDDVPHLIVGGESGAGKSEFLRILLTSVIHTQPATQVLISSSKWFDFGAFEGLPQLLGGRVLGAASDAVAAIAGLASRELPHRAQLLGEAGCFSIAEYNLAHPIKQEPNVVLVIDELAHLANSFTGTKRERTVHRDQFYQQLLNIAAVGRAYGIHLVVGTQRPSAELLPTDFRAQLSGRVALRVSDAQSSKMIIGMGGAEQLQKPGDMLTLLNGRLMRLQGYFATPGELSTLLKRL